MPAHLQPARQRGISLPPNGWALAILLALYIFPGLIGHDPWKHDDAVAIGIVHDLIGSGNWMTLSLAGRSYPDAPLYYWVAAASSRIFSWLLAGHEGARLASGAFTLLALAFILLAARELHGSPSAPAAPLLLAGSIGFLFHAHEAQPMLATLTAHTAAYWGLTQLARRPLRGASCFALALGLGLLANGLAPMLSLLPIAAFVAWRSENRGRTALLLLVAVLVACLLAGSWLLALWIGSPDFLLSLWQSELRQLAGSNQPVVGGLRLLYMLPWYAWPALPLAGWAVWVKRQTLTTTPMALPMLAFVATLSCVSLFFGARSAAALLLLPPLVLLAVPGVPLLRRGAANAFDWFGMITFTLFALLAWVVWSALVLGWPERLARQATRLQPGFAGELAPLAVGAALLATLVWCWLIASTPRSPMRGLLHWMAGLTLFWLLVATLWMPWVDYGKTYRGVSASLARALPENPGCIAGANLADSIVASLNYFDGLYVLPLRSSAGAKCNWLLVHGSVRDAGVHAASDWRRVWEGGRPSDRRDNERLRLYRREKASRG